MKKIVVGLIGLLVMASMACADTYTYTYVNGGNNTNLSAAIPVSGYLDKIEMSILAATERTSTVVVATYDGTTAVDTLGSVTLTGTKVIRLRVQPTDNTGTVIPSVWSAAGTDGTNASTILSVVYDKVLVGGNMKVSIANAHTHASTNKIVFYYEPLKH
jgi:hypothetical protein